LPALIRLSFVRSISTPVTSCASRPKHASETDIPQMTPKFGPDDSRTGLIGEP
jgi:hypothetical protein